MGVWVCAYELLGHGANEEGRGEVVRATVDEQKGKIMRESDAFVCVTCVCGNYVSGRRTCVHGMNESAFKKKKNKLRDIYLDIFVKEEEFVRAFDRHETNFLL